jgi:hypothetical protein
VYDIVRPPLERIVVRNWQRRGRPVPPPHLVKQAVVREYQNAFGLRVPVETGTFLGDMVASTKSDFEKIYTIELDETLYQRARKKFARFEHISLIHGDSGERLPEVLAAIEQPCLFWLDGHYSGGITARGEEETPVLRELEGILSQQAREHVVLIDDARCFTGSNGYPTIHLLADLLMEERPHWSLCVEDDIIRMHRRTHEPSTHALPHGVCQCQAH